MRSLRLPIVLTLLACGVPAFAESSSKVDVREDVLTLPWHTSEIRGTGSSPYHAKGNTKKRRGNRDFKVVALSNRFIDVQVVPEAGGAVARVIDKATGDDMFFREDAAKDWLPYWESGVKACFPWHEHGIRMDQPASYRVVHHDDGSKTIAMWMEFSRFDDKLNERMWGRFGTMLLSQHVTLRPDDASFTVTYRVTNPMPYRQGLRLWNDAIYPRNHTPEGIVHGKSKPPKRKTDTRWVFPANRVSDHLARRERAYDAAKEGRLADAAKGDSIFGWAMRHGFAGLYYPSVQVNRLRITDPVKAPGAKQFFGVPGTYELADKPSVIGNFVELWGGTDSIFEGVESWIGPGETSAFTHRFVMVRGIGQADYANDDLALHIARDEQGGAVVEVVTYRPHPQFRLTIDGQAHGESQRSDPSTPARFQVDTLPDSFRLKLQYGKRILADVSFPLELEVPEDAKQRIREANARDTAEIAERLGDAANHGMRYTAALKKYPDGSAGKGRVLYRMGDVASAIKHLQAATQVDPDDGEAWYMLGVARAEAEADGIREAFQRAIAAKRPQPAARFELARFDIARGDVIGAQNHLMKLLDAHPRHVEARLLVGFLESSTANARELLAAYPADPRAAYVYMHATSRHAAVDPAFNEMAVAAKVTLERLMQEPGAQAWIDRFVRTTQGQFTPPPRMQRKAAPKPQR